jgi:hypothetical protein
MFQHFEVSTPSIRLLQEVTDRAIDATASRKHKPYLARLQQHQRKTHQQHRQQQQEQEQQQQQERMPRRSSSTKEDALRDTEAGVSEVSGSLTDWQQLKQHLQSWTWSGRFSRLAGGFSFERLQELLSQREVSPMPVLSPQPASRGGWRVRSLSSAGRS